MCNGHCLSSREWQHVIHLCLKVVMKLPFSKVTDVCLDILSSGPRLWGCSCADDCSYGCGCLDMNMDKLILTESSLIQRWRLVLVGCHTSLNMGHQSRLDAQCSAHSTPGQRWLTRWLALDACHTNHKHNHNHLQANTPLCSLAM